MHSVQLSANVTMYKITQLIPSTEYRIQVACIIVNGTDPFSAYIEVLLSGDNSKFILTIISILILLYTYICKYAVAVKGVLERVEP